MKPNPKKNKQIKQITQNDFEGSIIKKSGSKQNLWQVWLR